MYASVIVPVRAALLAAALTFAAQPAGARPAAADPPVAARATHRTAGAEPAAERGDTLGGVLIIVGIVGVVIVLAWVCSRLGDSR